MSGPLTVPRFVFISHHPQRLPSYLLKDDPSSPLPSAPLTDTLSLLPLSHSRFTRTLGKRFPPRTVEARVRTHMCARFAVRFVFLAVNVYP